jgi:hypothetical protein
LVFSCGSALAEMAMLSVNRKAPNRASFRVFKWIIPLARVSAQTSPQQKLSQIIGRMKKNLDPIVGH